MAEETSLTLGFVGNDELHRSNTLALLKDYVGAFLQQHRKAVIRILLPEMGDGLPTDTMKDVDDWAGTAGYEIQHWSVGKLIEALLSFDNSRLILVGDPGEDDFVYAVAEEAAKHSVKTRSLINGLEKVVFEDDDFDVDEVADGFHDVIDDDDEVGLGGEAEQPDLDLLATLADDGELDAQEEIKSVAAALGIDTAPFDTWADAVVAIRGDSPKDGLLLTHQEDPADDGYYDVDVDPHFEPDKTIADPEVQPEEPVVAQEEDDVMPDKIWTRDELEALTLDEIKAVGLEHGIASGRGMKHKVFVNKILQANGTETEAPKAAKKAPAPAPIADVIPINSAEPSILAYAHEIIDGITANVDELRQELVKIADRLEGK